MAITIRSGKVLLGPSVGKAISEEVIKEDIELEECNPVEFEKQDDIDVPSNHQQVDGMEKGKHKLKKRVGDKKFSKFMAMLKKLTVNVPLVEALEQMLRYAKFMKDLVMKKRVVSYEPLDNLHHCSAISTRSLVQKKSDLGAFTISYTIGSLDVAKALCDIGARINLISLVVY
ncbi:uncharacterized protein LOC124896684 [Capsicum annuum]|uniref:uncharacterized protein LOC124896684 n=1 Tax=Capsicum annuum TaxID=4072 RepID=UPI001FB197AA|nr:uncharacterized protein LOC124896684 [Capsicum annuum]